MKLQEAVNRYFEIERGLWKGDYMLTMGVLNAIAETKTEIIDQALKYEELRGELHKLVEVIDNLPVPLATLLATEMVLQDYSMNGARAALKATERELPVRKDAET